MYSSLHMIIQHIRLFSELSAECLTNRCWRWCCGLFCHSTPNTRRFTYVSTTAAAVILRIDELILLNTFIYVCWHVHAHQQPFKYMGIIFRSEYIHAPPPSSMRPIPKPTKESGQRKREKVMRTSLRPHAVHLLRFARRLNLPYSQNLHLCHRLRRENTGM